MPFQREWNPRRGGSFRQAELDISAEIGERPSKHHTIHVVDHAKGFCRGNLAWADGRTQNRQQLHKIAARLEHENKRLRAKIVRLKVVNRELCKKVSIREPGRLVRKSK